MRTLRRMLAAMLIAAACFAPAAWATSFTTDQSDVWSVQAENGWGFQIVQRGSVIFVTMYVYDPTKQPIFYTATLFYTGNFVWAGDLYLTNGSWFGTVPYDQNSLFYRKVGAMQWTATSTDTGELRYDVDGVPVVKNAARLLLVYDDFSGHYGGGIHQTTTGCPDPAFNGTFEDIGILNITQNGQSIAISTFPTVGGSCSYSGTLTQAGQMGTVTGSYVCSNGNAGSFLIYEMQINPIGVTGRFAANSTSLLGCQLNGWFGGMRVTTF